MDWTQRGAIVIRTIAVLGLGTVFIWSGMVKVLDPEAFSLSVYRFHLLPAWAVNGVSLLLPMLELVCACCVLCIPKVRTSALWILVVLLLVFVAGLVINLVQGRQMSCGCFSSSLMAESIGWWAVTRNLSLIGCAVFVIRERSCEV